MLLRCMINGEQVEKETEPTKRLLDFLREDCGLTGVKEGCSEGECGACTVLLDRKAVTSCTVFAGQVMDREITTIEGLEQNGELDALQKAFIQMGAVQCGFCTPGIIIAVKSLLNKNPNPTEEEIKDALSGNYCRCISHYQVIEAVKSIL